MGIETKRYINPVSGADSGGGFGDLYAGPDKEIIIDTANRSVVPSNSTTINNNVTDNSTTVKGDGNVVNSNNGINNTIVKNVDSNNKGNLIGIIFTIIGIIIAW